MKSFQEWKNEKQYLELNVNPNANPIIPVTNTNYRGVKPIGSSNSTNSNSTNSNSTNSNSTNPNSTNPNSTNPNSTNPNSTNPNEIDPNEIDPAIKSQVDRMSNTIKSLPLKQQIKTISAVEDGVRAKVNPNLQKRLVKNDIAQNKEVLSNRPT